jgi:hypothetical protein
VVVRKVKSNFNNGAANRLEVIEDTTDEALCGPEPVNRDVCDADRVGFPADGGTNELAQVSVTEVSDSNQVWSCPCTHDCVLTAINVIDERPSANCCVEVGKTGCIPVIKRERVITNRCVKNAYNIGSKRGVAKSAVAESVNVTKERTGADSSVEDGTTGCIRVISQERASTLGRVADGKSVKRERQRAHGGISAENTEAAASTGINVVLKRRKANCRVVSGKLESEEVIILEREGPHSGVSSGINVRLERLPANCRVVVGIA